MKKDAISPVEHFDPAHRGIDTFQSDYLKLVKFPPFAQFLDIPLCLSILSRNNQVYSTDIANRIDKKEMENNERNHNA